VKSFISCLVLVVALLLSAITSKAGVTVQLKGNVKTATFGEGESETRFFYEEKEVSYSDTTGNWPIIIHEELAERLGPADWTVAFSEGSIVLLKEANSGFVYFHPLTECRIYPKYSSLVQAMIQNELEPGDIVNVVWDKEGMNFFANHFQLLKMLNEKTAQFRK